MKTRKYTYLFIVLLMLSACKKDAPKTTVVEFNSTTYKTLGTYNTSGRPDIYYPKIQYLLLCLHLFVVTSEHKDLRNTNPALLESKAIADIAVTQPTDIF